MSRVPRAARSVALPERVAWDELRPWESWRQGEHVTLIGPTGQGKTTAALELLQHRRYVIVAANKPRDPRLEDLTRDGFEIVREWPPPTWAHRVLFWPRVDTVEDVAAQRDRFRAMLRGVYRAGGWTLYLDELSYASEFLRLRPEVDLLLQQGRSLGVSCVVATQRPAYVSMLVYDQASHLFLWADADRHNASRLGRATGMGERVAGVLPRLAPHDCLYVRPRQGLAVVTRAPDRWAAPEGR